MRSSYTIDFSNILCCCGFDLNNLIECVFFEIVDDV